LVALESLIKEMFLIFFISSCLWGSGMKELNLLIINLFEIFKNFSIAKTILTLGKKFSLIKIYFEY